MAWTEAARAAAAEGRRAHSQGKKSLLRFPIHQTQGDPSKVGRKMIAQKLRLARAGKGPKWAGSRAATDASASTRLRNYQRLHDRPMIRK